MLWAGSIVQHCGLHPFFVSQGYNWDDGLGVYPLGRSGPLATRLDMFRIPSAKAQLRRSGT